MAEAEDVKRLTVSAIDADVIFLLCDVLEIPKFWRQMNSADPKELSGREGASSSVRTFVMMRLMLLT